MYDPRSPVRTGPPRRRRRRPRRRPALPLLIGAGLLLAAALLLPRQPTQPSAARPGEPDPLPPQERDGLLSQVEALCVDYPQAQAILDRPADYPDALLELLLRNQETLAFVLGYPADKDTSPAETVGEVTRGEFPLLMQWDARWGYAQYGDGLMAFTGCGPTVLSMVVCGLTGDDRATPYAVARYAQEQGYYVNGAGSSWELMSTGCRYFGLSARELPLMRSAITGALENGEPVVCSVGAGDFTTSGHFILLTGVEDGKFRVNDPNRTSTSSQLWDYDTLEPQIRNLWAYSLDP